MLRLLLTVVFLLGFSRPCFFALGLSNGSRDTLMMILRRLVALFFCIHLAPSTNLRSLSLIAFVFLQHDLRHHLRFTILSYALS